MKLTTLALASAFALSSTFAVAYTYPHHHQSGVRTHHGTVGVSSAGMHRGSMNSTNQGTVGMGRGSNNKGGLVGGSDSGTYKP
jgi:hypothetical protein